MSNQSIINPDNSKSYLKGAVDVTKLKVNNEPNLLQTIFVGKSNKYDRNLAMAANDPMGQRTREQNRLINQPTSEAFINAGIQAASEIGLGTLEGAGFLLDIPQWVNTIKGTEREFGNWFSDSINELKKEVAEDNPIYAAEGYHPTNAKWWASMIPSIATSASLMIPSVGGAKLMSTVGKLSTKLAKGIASNSKSANLLAKGLEKSGAALQNYTGVSAAVFSRMAEGTLEATEAGTQAYQKYMEEGMSMEEATEKAGQASAATFLGNMPLLALDLLQYNSIFKQFDTKVGIQAAENALNLSTKSLARRTLQKAWNTVKVPLGEGAEEGLQFGVKEESIKMAADGMPDNRIETIMKQYSDIAKNVLPEYFNNDEFLTSITLGAVGGKVFDAITPAVRRLAKMDNTVDEDLRSGKLLAPYYKTRKAFVDLLQQDEVKANEMLEAARTDPKLKLNEVGSFDELLKTYNDLKVDPLITKNANSDLIIKERMNEAIYSDLKEQLKGKSVAMPEGIDELDLKIDALTQLESYEMQTPSKNLRNIQEIRKRKATYIAEKTKNEIDGTKTTYKPKEGYSWGSRSHRAAINHYANMELADIMASIASSKAIAYESESGSMYADIDRKIQQKLEKIEDLELLRGSEDFDTDEKYINFLLEVKDKDIRPDLKEEVDIILDNLYKENIYDETHPINKLATTVSFNADGKTPNQFYSIYEANKTSAELTKEDTTKLRFRNLFSNSTSVNQLVTGDELKYSITPKIGTVVNFDKDDYVLYKLEDSKGFFISLKDSDTFELETSKIKPTDITTTYRTVKDPETNESLIILPNKAIVVGEGTVVYDRNSNNVEDIIRHDVLAEISNPKIFNIESNRRKELEKADIKIPAIKTIGSAVNLTPFTLGNKNKATRKEAARKLGLKERELVKLSYYEEGSKTLHSIPFMLVNGELMDTSNQFYDPEFDRRVFVKAQKYESQVDINNKIYNEINDRYNNKYLELLDDGTLTVNQAIALLNNKSPNLALRKKINELAALKYRVRTPKDIADILETISNKDVIIRKREQKSAYTDGVIADGMYEINGDPYHSTTALIEGVSNNNYPKSTDTNKDKFTKPGNTIDSLSREIFRTTELSRTSLIKKYKDLFSDETVLNDAITVIAKRKAILEKEGFTFISEGVILFSKQLKKNIAGETDLIAYDRLGNIHIMDVKTFSSKTYEDFKKGITGETLSKKDRYRVQLSAYADMFESRTNFKVSGISIIPYILERRDDGIITGIKTELTRLVNMQVISDINPLEYHSKTYNSAFEVLEVTEKTEGIITPKNIERVFNARLEHVKKELQESLVLKEFNITNFIVYYRDIIEFYNENKKYLEKIKKSDIDKLVSLYNNLQHASGLEGINDSVIVGKDLGLQIKDAINLKMGTVHLRNNDDSFFTIVDDKLHYIKRQYILSKVATELDPASDLYVIKSGSNSYRGTLESLKKLQELYIDINENNISAEQLVSAEELGFELMSEEQLLPGETYGFYTIQELKDGALKDIQFNIADVVSAQDNGMPIEDFIVAEAVDNNIKELTLASVKDKVKDIEDKIENLKSLEGESLTKEKLKKYFINSDEIELLDNAESLKKFYEDKLEYLQGQKLYYEQELFKDGIEVIPKEVIVEKLNEVNRDISLFEKIIAKLKEFIDVIIDAITNRERLGKAEITLKEKQNIKNYLQELLDSDIFTNVEQPEITDTDIQELKDLGLVIKGNKPVNLKNKGKFRKIKNKYIGKKLYISPGVDIDKFIKDVDNDNIIHVTEKLPESYITDLLDNEHPDKIIIISNPNILQKEGLIDNIIAISNPKEDIVNKDIYTKENGFIYNRIVTGKDEEFVSKVEFIKYGDSLLDFMTESVKAITEEDIADAELNYSFQYSGLVDTEITYNPYKDSTLVMRGDYVPTEAADEAVYGSFYPRIAADNDELNNIIDDLMSRGIETIDGQTITPTYSREIYESLYKDKSKKDLFTKSAVVLVNKTAQGKINIVLAYKEINNGIPNYVPVGLMNTLEQSLYAYSTTPEDKNKPRAANNIIMSNFIRNEIEALVTPSMPFGKLVELDYDKIKFTGARTTGLNKTQNSDSVSKRINTDDPNVYVIQKTNSGTTIYAHNPTSEEYELLEYYKEIISKDDKKGFGVYYRTEDKLGNTVILPATLRKFYEAPKKYKEGLQKLVEQLIVEKSTTRVLLNGVRSNEVKLQELINEIKNNYAYFDGNIDKFDSYDEFISVNNINNTNMVINYVELQGSNTYRKELMDTYLTTNIAKDPYVNTQYIFGITPEIYNRAEFDEAIEEEPLVAEGLFYEEEDKVKTNRFLVLNDDVRKSIKQPLNYETHYRNEIGTPPQYIGEIENSFNTQYGVTYSESFNEFVKALDSVDTEDIANVLRHVFKNTKNSFIKSLLKDYTSVEELILDYLSNPEKDFTKLKNYIEGLKKEINTNKKLIKEFYNKLDDAYFLDNEPELDLVTLAAASRALLALAIQEKKLDFADPNKLISIIKGSTEKNFFLNELVLMLLERTNAANLTKVVKLIKALRPDIQTIEITEQGEFVLVKNTRIKPDSGKLYSIILKGLKKYGYDVNITSESYVHDDLDDLLTIIEEEKDSREAWSIVKTFQFPTTTLNKNTKILLQSIISDDKDTLGLGINLNYSLNTAYAITIDKLVNSKNVDDLKKKMSEYSQSIEYIKRLKNYIDSSINPDELYGQLYVAIGNKIRVTYKTIIKDKNESVYPVLSNRQSPENIISTMLNEGIKTNTTYTSSDIIDSLNLSSKEKAQLNNIEVFKTKINAILDRYRIDLKLYNAVKDDKEFYDKYKSTRSEYTFDTREYGLDKIKNQTIAKNLIKDLVTYIPKSSNAAHMTVEKTMQYQDTTGNFIGYVQNNRKEYFKNLKQDPLYETLPAIDRDNDFEVVQVIGYDDQYNDNGIPIGKLDNKLTAEILLSMHKKENSYPVPVPGDSGNMVFVNNIVPTKVDINKELYKLMLFEKNRIESIKDRDRGVKSYATNGKDYVIFKAIDKILKEGNKEFNESEVTKAFDTYFNSNVDDFIKYLKNLDILKQDGSFKSKLQGFKGRKTVPSVGTFSRGGEAELKKKKAEKARIENENIEETKKELIDFLKRYTASYVNITLLTINDPSYYPRIEEVFKRAKQNISPGQDMNMNASYTNPKNTSDRVVLNNDTPMLVTILNDVDDFFTDDPQYEEIAKALKSIKKDRVINEFDGTSETDGQAYIDPIAYRQRMVGLEEWTHDDQAIMDDLMVGKSVVSYNVRNNKVSTDSKFTTLKPYYYYNGSGILRNNDGLSYYNEPIQIKDSEMLITPYYGLKKLKNKEGKFVDNPNYNGFFRNILEGRFGYTFDDTTHTVTYNAKNRKSDLVVFNSAVKEGLPIKEKTENASTEIESKTKSTASLLFGSGLDSTITLPFRFWKKQNETPKGHFSKESIYGTQLMKLIMADIPDGATFKIGNKILTKEQIEKEYNDILITDVETSITELKKKYGDGKKFIVEKFVRVLQQEMEDDTINMQKALEFTFDENGNITTNLPLAHPFVTNRVQPKTNAIFKNNVTVRKFLKGFKAANASSYGFENKPKIVWNKDKFGIPNPELGIEHFEVIAPIHDKKIYQFVDEVSGIVDMKKLEETYPELLEGLLYRIPTEDKYSMFKVKIIGFLPNEDGAIIMPSMVTTLSGMDFDIDKMFGFFKSKGLNELEYFNQVYFKEKTITKNALISNIQKEHGKNPNTYPDEVKEEYNKIIKDYNDIEANALKKGTKANDELKASLEEYNKSLVSDNNKLDIMRAVLSHPTTLKSQLIPGGFKMIEEEVLNMRYYDMLDENLEFVDKSVTPEVFAAKNTDKKALLNTNARTFIDPTLWIDTVNAMNVGKDMTGIAANHNAARAIMQQSGIKLLDDLVVKHGNSVTNTKTVNFSDIYDFDGDNTIIKSFSIILAAVLDNGKNPLISYFGLNPSNANTAMAAVHLGYPLKSVIYFNKAYTNMLSKSILNDEEKKAISSEIDKGNNRIIDINLEDIITYIKHRKHIEKIELNSPNFNKELINIEKKIYRNYYILQQLGVEFNDIVTYIQRGNRGGKPTFFENYVDIRKYNNYIENPEVKYFDAESIKNHFKDDKKFTTRFNKFIGEQNNEVVKLLSLPGFFNTDEKGLTSFRTLIETKEFIKKLDDKILGKLYNALYYKATVESQSSYFNLKDKELEFLNEDMFLELKKKYSDNRFINALQIDNKYEGEGLKLQLLVVDFKDKDQQDLITQDWRRLIQNKDPQTKLIGELLAVYSLRTTGYDTTRDSFNHLIPVEFYTESLDNYSKKLNDKIIELVNNPATGVNLLSMILSKYNYPTKTFSDNVNVTREGNTKSISILNTEIGTLDATPLYYNVYDFNKDKFNDTVVIDTEEEDINELGSELNPEVNTIQNKIVKLKEFKDTIAKLEDSTGESFEEFLKEVFTVISENEINTFIENNLADDLKNNELIINKFKELGKTIKSEEEIGFLGLEIYLPIYIDKLIVDLEKQLKQDKKPVVSPKIDTSKEWKGDLESRPVYTNEGINTMRTSAALLNEHFGNPFSEAGYGNTIKVDTIADAVIAYKDWLLGTKHNNVNPEQREWIINQINQGKLDGATLLYAGKSEARGQGMHPTALVEVFDILRNTIKKDTTKKEEPFSGLKGEQLKAAQRIAKEFNNKKDRKPLLILGRAGTGKTFMLAAALKEIVKTLPGGTKLNIVGSALANAAKNQLADSLSKAKLDTFPGITLKYHSVASLLNSVKSKLVQTNTGKGKSKIIDYKKQSTILIVDEMSMLSEDDYKKIEDDADNNVLIIYAGDHGQLPSPTKSFSLKDKIGKDNILNLTASQRQVSGSPILDYLDPIWENATEQPKAEKYIPVPNVLTPSGGIASINQAESLDNIVELYKKAIDTGNTNYVQFLSYENKYIKAFNQDIRKKIFGDDIKSYNKSEFIIFNDSTTVYVDGKEETVDNGTRAIIQEVLKDKESEFTLKLTDLRGKEVSLTGRKYRISYKLNDKIVETTVKLLDVADQYEYEKLIGAIEYLNGNFPVTKTQVDKFGKYLEYDFGQTRVKEGNVYKDRNNNVEKTTRDKRINNLVQFAAQIATFADANPSYATTVHKSQGMTTDVAIYDYTTTNNTLEYILSRKTTPQDKKDAELLIHKANYTASSRAKHLMLLIDGNNSSINNEGSFVDIVDRIKSGTQEKVQLTISDKKSKTETEGKTTTTKEKVLGTLSNKTVFSKVYITAKTKKKKDGLYKLKDGTLVTLKHFVDRETGLGITYDKLKKRFKIGKVEYTPDALRRALGFKTLNNNSDILKGIYKKSKDVNVYLLTKYTPPKESTTTTPPTTTKPPKSEKPKEVVIDMTKQFEMYGEKFIPLLQEGNVLRIINLSNNTQQYIENINSYKSKIKTTDVLIERSKKDIAIPRIKSGSNIYIVQGDKVSVYPKLSKFYNSVNKDYFTCQ